MKKEKDFKEQKIIQQIYSRSLLTRSVTLEYNCIGSNLTDTFQEYVTQFEGKCSAEGFIKPNSTKIINYSSGVIQSGNKVVFEIMFECDICFPIAGMLLQCVVTSVVKAGISAESSSESPSPFIVFVAKDHHYSNAAFNAVQQGDVIQVRVIGQRLELNDKYISVIGEMVTPLDRKEKKQRISIEK